jgi:hypothetical protein
MAAHPPTLTSSTLRGSGDDRASVRAGRNRPLSSSIVRGDDHPPSRPLKFHASVGTARLPPALRWTIAGTVTFPRPGCGI